MTFVSYAQNFEDVILHRALKDVEKGFYIDVGAYDPVVDSVTKLFYDAGWRGINIEPVKESFEKFERERPHDINLCTAVGDRKGELEFYEVVGTGLSTTDKSIAERHKKERGYEIKKYKVPVERLSGLCEGKLPDDVHFMKIDVEGAELPALQGLDMKMVRPWIFVIESTLPNLTIEHYAEWEPILIAEDYEFVYFDGLNRFYVAKEKQDIGDRLRVPPNVFDDFFLSGLANGSVHYQIAEIKSTAAEANRQREEVQTALGETEQQNKQLVGEVQTALKNAVLQDKLLRKKEELLRTKENALHEKDEKLKDATSGLAGRDRRIEELQEQATAMEGKLRAANIEVARNEKQLEGKKKELQALARTHKELKRELEKIKGQADTVQESLARRDWALRDAKAELSELQCVSQRLASELKTVTDQVEHLEEESTNWRREAMRLQEESMIWQQEATRVGTELSAVYDSKSWRLTLPLRKLWKPFERKHPDVSSAPVEMRTQAEQDEVSSDSEEPAAHISEFDEEAATDKVLDRIRAELTRSRRGESDD
jgi:FkbM family methyltransferase